ncbi:MAG: hypothetical protein QM820_15275 [Minicystis sp.]
MAITLHGHEAAAVEAGALVRGDGDGDSVVTLGVLGAILEAGEIEARAVLEGGDLFFEAETFAERVAEGEGVIEDLAAIRAREEGPERALRGGEGDARPGERGERAEVGHGGAEGRDERRTEADHRRPTGRRVTQARERGARVVAGREAEHEEEGVRRDGLEDERLAGHEGHEASLSSGPARIKRLGDHGVPADCRETAPPCVAPSSTRSTTAQR